MIEFVFALALLALFVFVGHRADRETRWLKLQAKLIADRWARDGDRRPTEQGQRTSR